uniref:seipin-1 n=1 Tax=Erigeron canadensis TaxID=72917 RepID=UPI001CB92148|nr:seipin-1 [Erigeron canadensis]
MNPQENQHQQNPAGGLLSQQPNTLLNSIILPFISIFSSSPATKQTSDDTTTPNYYSENNISISMLFKKAMMGFLAAGYMCLLLMGLMMLSVVLGVFLVRLWVEEPVFVQQNLYFDYTDVNPYAVLDFGLFVDNYNNYYGNNKVMMKGIPVGHMCDVRLAFVMPDSDYNRYLGMFQVVAESVSSNGDVIARTSHPCMPHFRSEPIRAMQTLLWSAPLVLGFRSEIQTVNMPLLRYKEHYHPRTQAIRISIIPRAGTPFLPQLYEAKITVRSELPWRKALVRNWKWTFYVWTSLYVYLTLLVLLVSCFRSIRFPAMTTFSGYQRLATSDDSLEEPPRAFGTRGRPTSENLKRWRQGRSKRKAMGGGSDATSMSVTRHEDASVATEEVGDSESVCQ